MKLSSCLREGQHAHDPMDLCLHGKDGNPAMGNLQFKLPDSERYTWYVFFHGCDPHYKPQMDMILGPYKEYGLILHCPRLRNLQLLNYPFGYACFFVTPLDPAERIMVWDNRRKNPLRLVEYNFTKEFFYFTDLHIAADFFGGLND